MSETETVLYRITIKGRIEDVWHELTKLDEPQECFFNMRMHTAGTQENPGQLGPGAPIRMRTKNGRYTGVVGEVLEFDPPHRFAHTFKFTNMDDPECVVIHELRETPDGVEFTMRARNLPVGTKTAKQMTQGGKMIANTLKNMVEKGKPSFGTRCLFLLFRAMEPMSPKSMRSEHWPMERSC